LAVLVVRRAAAVQRRAGPDPPCALRPAVALLWARRRRAARALAALAPRPARPAGAAVRVGRTGRRRRRTHRTVRAGAGLAGRPAVRPVRARRRVIRTGAPPGGPDLGT